MGSAAARTDAGHGPTRSIRPATSETGIAATMLTKDRLGPGCRQWRWANIRLDLSGADSGRIDDQSPIEPERPVPEILRGPPGAYERACEKAILRCAPFSPAAVARHSDLYRLRARPHPCPFPMSCAHFFEESGVEPPYCRFMRRYRPAARRLSFLRTNRLPIPALSYRAYMQAVGKTELADDHAELCRNRLTSVRPGSGRNRERLTWLIESMTLRRQPAHVSDVQRQETRLYGHSLSDIIALCNIAGLEPVCRHREIRGSGRPDRTFAERPPISASRPTRKAPGTGCSACRSRRSSRLSRKTAG